MKCNEINIRVRYQETDQMGIVYYSNYLVYFEMGRIEFLRNLGISYAEIEKENIFLAVVEARCRYRAPAMFDDLLVIKTCLSGMKYARIEFCYEIRRINEEHLIAEGSTLLACLGANRKPIAIPERIRKVLAQLVNGHPSPPE